MQTEKKLFDDLARVAGGAFGALAGAKNEVESRLKHQVEAILARLNLVTREDHEGVLAMVAAARTAQEALEVRVAALEGGSEKSALAKAAVKKPKTAS